MKFSSLLLMCETCRNKLEWLWESLSLCQGVWTFEAGSSKLDWSQFDLTKQDFTRSY